MKLAIDVPDAKKIRLIVNSDAKNEADDQYAIVHSLLTSQFVIKGLIGAHFGSERSKTSMLDSVKEIKHLLDIMGLSGEYSVFHGAECAMQDEWTPALSEGAELIVREAMSDDQRPLFVSHHGSGFGLPHESRDCRSFDSCMDRRRNLAGWWRRIQPSERHPRSERRVQLSDAAMANS
jgi:hypothetical protein